MTSAKPPRARAIVLGAGAGGGVPQWNCGCRVCAMVRAGDIRVRPATQASLAVSGDGETWLVVNASPDLRSQVLARPELSPRGLRGSPIGDVLLTGGEVDQIAGLLTMREREVFRLHAARPVLDILAANPVFAALSADHVERRAFDVTGVFEAAGLEIRIVPLEGKVPLYMEGEGVSVEAQADGGIGLLIGRRGGGTLAYVPGCAAITPTLRDMLSAADIVMLDGTVFDDNELGTTGVGHKTGRRMGHVPVSGQGGTLELMRALAPRRRIYTHINNTNPMLIEGSPERRQVEAAGVEISHDGMELSF